MPDYGDCPRQQKQLKGLPSEESSYFMLKKVLADSNNMNNKNKQVLFT